MEKKFLGGNTEAISTGFANNAVDLTVMGQIVLLIVLSFTAVKNVVSGQRPDELRIFVKTERHTATTLYQAWL